MLGNWQVSSQIITTRDTDRETERENKKRTYRFTRDLRIWFPVPRIPSLGLGHINDPIHDDMRDMYTLRAKLPGERLGESAQGKFAAGEGSALRAAFDRGGSAGKNQGGWIFRLGDG